MPETKRLPQYYEGVRAFTYALYEQKKGRWHTPSNPYGADTLAGKEWQAGYDSAYIKNLKEIISC